MFLSIQAQIHLLLGHPESACDAARDAMVSDPYYWRARYWLVRALLANGDGAGADSVAEASREALATTRSPAARVWQLFLSAEIALARDLAGTARDALSEAAALSPGYRDRQMEEEIGARQSLALGDPTSAIDAYRRVIDPPYPRLGREFEHGDWRIIETAVLYPLGCLEESRGEVARAAERFRQYLARWGDPDVPLPIVRDAMQRVESISAARGTE